MGYRFFKINKYEPAEDEKRLEELAAKGEFIKSSGMGIAYFKKGEPKKVRYCIEASMFRPNRKIRAAYAESGWKFAARGSDLNVYVAEDENAVPIHTDRSEYAHVIEKYHRTAKKFMIFYYVMVLLAILEPYIFFPLTTSGLVTSLVTLFTDSWLIDIFIESIAVYLIVMFPLIGFYLHEYTTAGLFIAGSIENGKSAEKAITHNRIIKALFAALIILAITNLTIMLIFRSYADTPDEKFSGVPSRAITIEHIFGDERIEYLRSDEDSKKYIAPELYSDKVKGFEAHTITSTSIVGVKHDYWQCAAYIPEGEEYGTRTTLHGKYTEFRNEWLAKQGAKEYREYEQFFFFDKDAEHVILDTSGTPFDSAEYIAGEKSGVYIVLRQDCNVYEITVQLPTDSGLTVEELFGNIADNYAESVTQ